MAEPVAGIAQSVLSQNLGEQKMQQQAGAGGRSFETVLQQTGGANGGAEGAAGAGIPDQPAAVSGAKLEQMRLDLTERLNRLPPGTSNLNALLPELIDSRTRLGMLNEVMSKAKGTPVGTDLRGRFGQIEQEWFQVESIMKSNKDLSTTELLGLQARLYQVSQHVEVLSKVVDQMTSGVKTILSTNV